MATYTQLRFSRSDGRSWTTGVAGLGLLSRNDARSMAKSLVASRSVTHIEVVTEDRNGAETRNQRVYRWSTTRGWH